VLAAREDLTPLSERVARNSANPQWRVVRLNTLSLESDPANFFDCLHPSDVGYHKVADAWRAALARE